MPRGLILAIALCLALALCLAPVGPGPALAQQGAGSLFPGQLGQSAAPLAGSGAAGEASAPGAVPLAAGPGDAAIESRIATIIGALQGYEGIRAEVTAGIVTLEGETSDPARMARLETLIGALEGVVAVESRVAATADLGRRLDPAWQRLQSRAAQALAALPLLAVAALVAAAIAALGFALARWDRPWARLAPNAFIAEIYRQFLRLGFVLAGLVVALDILNATALLGTILGAAGLIGLAIGFAVKDTVENFIASVMLSIRQPFRPNDAVEINGDQGLVIRLTSRATILLSFEGNHIRIPNATVFKSRIVNFTRNAERRFDFAIGVNPEADLAAARALLAAALEALPFTLAEPPVAVWLERLDEGGAVLTCTGWIDQRRTGLPAARGEAIRAAKAALDAAGIEIPDTTYRIRLEGGAPAGGMPSVAGAEPAGADRGAPAPSGPQTPARPAERAKALAAVAVPAPETVAPTGTETLERRAAEEADRAANLLSPAAPEE